MTLEIRPKGTPEEFDLYDGDDRIGEILIGYLSDEDIAEGEAPYWEIAMWSGLGTGKEWRGDSNTLEDAQECARELYQEFVAERREMSKGSRPRTVSVPMGGQKRRR